MRGVVDFLKLLNRDARVDLRRLELGVRKHLLDQSDVGPVLHHVRRAGSAELLEDNLAERQHKITTRHLECDLLIIDDMGIKQLPPKSGEDLFEIVMLRYEVKATMMTSNRPLEEWGQAHRRRTRLHRILDHFLHHDNVIKIAEEAIGEEIKLAPNNPKTHEKPTLRWRTLRR